MIKVKRNQIGRDRNLGVTLNTRQWWVLGWRHARLVTRRWWMAGNTFAGENDAKVKSAWKQAPLAFKCLVARNQYIDITGKPMTEFSVWKVEGGSGMWYHTRPDKWSPRHPWP